MTEAAIAADGWLLAIDTSTEEAGVALSNGRAMAEINWTASRDQTVTVLDQIDRLISLMRLEPSHLSVVSVATGPGMFNGLRVGMSVAKGLVIGLGLPLIGISTLEVTALPYLVAGVPVVPVVAAGRGRLVWAVYEAPAGAGWRQVEAPRNEPVDTLARWAAAQSTDVIVCGELTEDQAAALTIVPSIRMPPQRTRSRRAAAVLDLARLRLARGETDDPVTLEPIYLHAARAPV